MRRCWGALLCALLLSVPLGALAQATPQPSVGLGLKPASDSQFLLSGLKAAGFGLFAVLVVGAGLWAWRRRLLPALAQGAGDSVPQVQSSRRISQKTVLQVVRWRGRCYLLAESNGAITVVDTISDEAAS